MLPPVPLSDSSSRQGSTGPASEGPAKALPLLNKQVSELRLQIAALRRELVAIQSEIRKAPALRLLEENRRLRLAVKDAETRASDAIRGLVEMARKGERDVLTDTPNRTLMLDRVGRGITLARRRRLRLALLFADLDGFKQINDTYGHAAGDTALRMAARRLESAVRDSDTVSRHGGDEFLVLLGGLSNASDAGVISAKLLASLAEPVTVGEHVLRLSASIGIAVYPEDGEDAASLIDSADAAMFRSKRRGPGCFEYSRPELIAAVF
jgi:diguanylate cyclase (GGDEF)-like protein